MLENEDLFIQHEKQGSILSEQELDSLFSFLSREFSFSVEGALDWSSRHYSKKWYLPRRGQSGLQQLLSELPIDHKTTVSVMRSDKETVFHDTAKTVFSHIPTLIKTDTNLVIIPNSLRWILEIGADDYLYFDFLVPGEKEFCGLYGTCPL